ncbi:hypothetical protein SDC9_143908 [bioreactor metagenome]|uniref:Uncharacterized protein n=1 Tax=bioreactor metagenome TaxID=1076179 RepID=A0A645E7D3_9ZZZZ
MGTTSKKYDIAIKKKAIDLYFKQGMGYKVIAKELDIGSATLN